MRGIYKGKRVIVDEEIHGNHMLVHTTKGVILVPMQEVEIVWESVLDQITKEIHVG